MMKFLIVILSLIVLTSAEWKPKSREQMKQFRVECVRDLNLPQNIVDKLNRQEYPENNEYVMEYILCGARKSELWSDNEGWLSERILRLLGNDKTLNKEEVRSVIDGCLDDNSQGSSLQEWCFRNFKCLADSKLRGLMRGMMQKLN
ncbi:general odorant-binding protein 99a-like [Episyrphus balteatus]|uniref:general odorant-binding protein 99a-like n=1 Tax=Episyrphus balteatus TaxID=286459 RepID=UPI0024854EC3|nr:general odorant-binding protein 99a-like [Episyrphus balteatus]